MKASTAKPASPDPAPQASERSNPNLLKAQPQDSVPMLDLQRQYEQVRAEVLEAVGRVCASQHYVLGAEVEQFEGEMGDFCGARQAVGCSSGTDALWLALLAAGVQPGDRVLTTPFSFFASASAIVRAGARPVFADIEPWTFNLDPVKVADLLRNGGAPVKALLPVHLYGQCAAVDAFQRLAGEFRVALLEDAAQAIGASWQGKRAGSSGAAAAFSFYPTKNLSAYGEAGLVTTSNAEMAAHMRRLRNHGSSRRYLHEEFGWNSRLDAMQAAILRVKLKYVERWNQARRERAATYDQLFVEAGLAQKCADIATNDRLTNDRPKNDRPSAVNHPTVPEYFPVRLPRVAAGAHHVFHQYVIRAFRRDELRQFLTARKIGSEIYYPIPLHLQPCFSYLGYLEGDLPEAERAAKEVLALPMFPEVTEEEQRWTVQSIADFYC